MSNAVEGATVLTPNVRSFLTQAVRYATIATINPDGGPHQIVIWFLLRSQPEGERLIVNSRRGRRWPANLARDGRANLAVYEAEDAVTIECRVVDSYEGEQAQADIAEMAWRFDEPDYAQREIARFRTENRITFVLEPTRVLIHGNPA